jgi:hypothetical protein
MILLDPFDDPARVGQRTPGRTALDRAEMEVERAWGFTYTRADGRDWRWTSVLGQFLQSGKDELEAEERVDLTRIRFVDLTGMERTGPSSWTDSH